MEGFGDLLGVSNVLERVMKKLDKQEHKGDYEKFKSAVERIKKVDEKYQHYVFGYFSGQIMSQIIKMFKQIVRNVASYNFFGENFISKIKEYKGIILQVLDILDFSKNDDDESSDEEDDDEEFMQMQPTIVTPTNTNKPEDNNKDEENEDSKHNKKAAEKPKTKYYPKEEDENDDYEEIDYKAKIKKTLNIKEKKIKPKSNTPIDEDEEETITYPPRNAKKNKKHPHENLNKIPEESYSYEIMKESMIPSKEYEEDHYTPEIPQDVYDKKAKEYLDDALNNLQFPMDPDSFQKAYAKYVAKFKALNPVAYIVPHEPSTESTNANSDEAGSDENQNENPKDNEESVEFHDSMGSSDEPIIREEIPA